MTDTLDGDKSFDLDTIQLVVDKQSSLYLIGSQLDYSSGLNGKGFEFINPNLLLYLTHLTFAFDDAMDWISSYLLTTLPILLTAMSELIDFRFSEDGTELFVLSMLF